MVNFYVIIGLSAIGVVIYKCFVAPKNLRRQLNKILCLLDVSETEESEQMKVWINDALGTNKRVPSEGDPREMLIQYCKANIFLMKNAPCYKMFGTILEHEGHRPNCSQCEHKNSCRLLKVSGEADFSF